MSPTLRRVADVTEALYDKVVEREPQGPVPADRARRHAHGGGRRRLDHQRFERPARSIPSPNVIPYAAAKAGLNAMTVGLRAGVRPEGARQLHHARPVPAPTSRRRGTWTPFEAARARPSPLQRGGEPDEIVGAALYFATDASSYTTGADPRASTAACPESEGPAWLTEPGGSFRMSASRLNRRRVPCVLGASGRCRGKRVLRSDSRPAGRRARRLACDDRLIVDMSKGTTAAPGDHPTTLSPLLRAEPTVRAGADPGTLELSSTDHSATLPADALIFSRSRLTLT